jgi:dihydroflavonol-4-reductase
MSFTAFVTGATGFVGSHVVRELHRQGWTVHLLARRTSPLDEISDIPHTRHEGDITDAESLDGAIPDGADAVFHVAASTNFWSRRNAEQSRINVDGTANLIEASMRAGARRFIHTSSFVTWGFTGRLFDETSARSDRYDWINYVHTKTLSEQLVLDAAGEGHIDAVVTNPANVLGPGDRHNWSRLFRMVQDRKLPLAPSGGGNFCDVREVAKAHVSAFHEGRRGERYLLGGPFARYIDVMRIASEVLNVRGPTRTAPGWVFRAVAQVLQAAGSISGREPDVTPESAAMAAMNIRCDSAKAIRELDYREAPLEVMVADTITWMKTKGLLR